MRLRINQGSVSLQGTTILDHCDFEIRGKEKIALVGENGAGKTTLLHLISGQLSLDLDDKRFEQGIWMARNTSIGILEQTPFFEKDISVEELMEQVCPVEDLYSKERYEFEISYQRMFTMFGFRLEDKKKMIHSFSGGEQTKIALIRLLLMKPDILLLDEPTNHLDMDTIRWLEEYLKNYEKAVVVVSHDRFFLDEISTVVYEIHQGKTKRYVGNYSNYREEREKQYISLKKKYLEQQEEIKRLNELIEKFKHKPKKASMARSKKKVLERMEKVELPDQYRSFFYGGEIIPLRQGSKWIYDCQKLIIGYDQAIQEINLRIKRGQKIGIIGPNGVGKTTFLKTLAGKIPALKGNVVEGSNIDPVYFDQMTADIQGEDRLLQDFQQTYPAYNIGDCRKKLANFMFRKEDVSKTISSLSGGEKSRYTFAKLLEEKPNVLLLDEPTNHLDIPSKEILESAFQKFAGSILFVTHDRYFLKQVANSLLIFEKDHIVYYPYGYARYLEYLDNENRRQLQGIRNMDEENERLWRSFEEVPEKKRIQSARFNTEQSYTDWQLELISDKLHQVSLRYQCLWEKLYEGDLSCFDQYHEYFDYSEEEYLQLKKEIEDASLEYEEVCKEWYEKWLEYEEAFENYYDA